PVDKISKSDLLQKISSELKYPDLDAMHVAIGAGHLSPQTVTTRVIRLFQPEDEPEAETVVEHPPRRRPQKPRGKGVIVEGVDDLLVRLARCCTPVPGDPIVGFLTRGRGVSVHRDDCPNAKALHATDEGRIAKVWWDDRQQGTFMVSIQIEALDRTKLLRDVTTAISDQGIHIVASSAHRPRRHRDVDVHVRARGPVAPRARHPERPAGRLRLRRLSDRPLIGPHLIPS
ncbi:MAG: DUF5913 domain-containing protein, partial [Actinomycetota bacterium]|nr:DUF5913 domain-containing protein [Actinomycetota bacterium]